MGDMTRVKICGIKSLEDARAAVELGADALGFLVEIEGANNSIGAATASAFISQLPPFVTTTVVTLETDPRRLSKLARATGAQMMQLQGEVTPDDVRALKALMFYLKISVAIHAGDRAFERAKNFEDSADAILLDSAISETGARGGTGKTHDLDASRKIVESLSIPVILAGGLNPANVAEAIEKVKPYAVDVQTGVSNPDGSKDLEKVKIFIERARMLP